jgi:hypothetical protein
MSVDRPAAYGLYAHDVAPHEIACVLNQAGFGNEDICLVLSPNHPIATVLHDASILSPEPEARAATAGLIDWLSQFGAIVVPDTGFFIRSQAFCRALTGTKDGMALRGNWATLVALGFPEDQAERFENELRLEAGVLVYVSCAESAKTGWAVELLRGMGARESASLASLKKELGAKGAA